MTATVNLIFSTIQITDTSRSVRHRTSFIDTLYICMYVWEYSTSTQLAT